MAKLDFEQKQQETLALQQQVLALRAELEANKTQMQQRTGITGPRQRVCPQTLDAKERYIALRAADGITLFDTECLVKWLNLADTRALYVHPHPDTYYVLKALEATNKVTLVPDCRKKIFDYNETVKLSVTKRSEMNGVTARVWAPKLPYELERVRRVLMYVKRTSGMKEVNNTYGGYRTLRADELPAMRTFMSGHGISSDLICTFMLALDDPFDLTLDF